MEISFQRVLQLIGFGIFLIALAACATAQHNSLPQLDSASTRKYADIPPPHPSCSPPPTPPPTCGISSQAQALIPPPQSRTTIGVNERVTINSQHGCLLTVTNSTGGGGTLDGNEGTGTLTAGGTAGTVTVTANSITQKTSITFTVIEPSGVFFQRVGGVKHTQGSADVGIEAQPYFQPDTVSFGNIYWYEEEAYTTGTGTWACIINAPHEPAPKAWSTGPDVIGYGSKINSIDQDYSAWCSGVSQFQNSMLQWTIPEAYSPQNNVTGYDVQDVLETATDNTSGNLSMVKGQAASPPLSVPNPSSTW